GDQKASRVGAGILRCYPKQESTGGVGVVMQEPERTITAGHGNAVAEGDSIGIHRDGQPSRKPSDDRVLASGSDQHQVLSSDIVRGDLGGGRCLELAVEVLVVGPAVAASASAGHLPTSRARATRGLGSIAHGMLFGLGSAGAVDDEKRLPVVE